MKSEFCRKIFPLTAFLLVVTTCSVCAKKAAPPPPPPPAEAPAEAAPPAPAKAAPPAPAEAAPPASAEEPPHKAIAERTALASPGPSYDPTVIAPPVYNIEVDPRMSMNPLILFPDYVTKLIFYIGPESPGSVIKGIPPSELLGKYSKGQTFLDLTVTLLCRVCIDNTRQQGYIRYYPELGQSTKGIFEIIPKESAVKDSNCLGNLIFTVDYRGNDIDRLLVNTFVGFPPSDMLLAYLRPLKNSPYKPVNEKVTPADVLIDITTNKGGGKLFISIRPRLENLRRHFEEYFGAGEGLKEEQAWTFTSGLTKPDLEIIVFDIYKTFRTIIEQKNTKLQQTYWNSGRDIIMSESAARLEFNTSDLDKMLKVLREEGARLYDFLFKKGDEDLRQAVSIIDNERFNLNRPLRIIFRPEDVYAPWQILYPKKHGPIDPKLFWGFRYELGIVQQLAGVKGHQQHLQPTLKPNEIMYAYWWGDNGTDDVTQRAILLRDLIKKNSGGNLLEATNREEFLAKLKLQAREIKFVVAFGHGSSGTQVGSSASGNENNQILVETDWSGMRFEFRRDNFIVPRTLDSLTPDNGDETFFRSQPIVMLNACETGTFGAGQMNNLGFVGAFERMGAGAVFVTEAPVWQNFAFQFGSHLIEELFKGNETGRAMWNVRLKHLKKWNNPLGLVYSLYGDPTMSIKKP